MEGCQHIGGGSEVVGVDILGGISEADLQMGTSRKRPLRPPKDDLFDRSAEARRAEQSPWVLRHLSLVLFVSFVCLMSHLFFSSPLRGIPESPGSLLTSPISVFIGQVPAPFNFRPGSSDIRILSLNSSIRSVFSGLVLSCIDSPSPHRSITRN